MVGRELSDLTFVLNNCFNGHVYRFLKMCYTILNLVTTIDQTASLHLLLIVVNLSKFFYSDSIFSRQLYLSYYITSHLAKVIIVKLRHICDLTIISANDACWVPASYSHISELHRYSIKYNHTFSQDVLLCESKDNLHDFHCLQLADKPRYHTKNTAIRAIGHGFGWGW